MSQPVNESRLFRSPTDRVTVYNPAAVTGKRFVVISGAKVSTAGDEYNKDLITVAQASVLGSRVYGVACQDKAAGARVMIWREGEVEVTAGAVIVAGAAITTNATGQAITATGTDVVCGIATNAAASGAPVTVDLSL